MKVGVFYNGQTPEAGGGFTFQDNILHDLPRLESKHTFVVFSNLTKDQLTGLSVGHMEFVSSQCGFLERARYKFIRITGGVIGRVPIVRNCFQFKPRNWVKEAVVALGIEVMWFMAPTYSEVDIPYIFTVWDLQHRLQPWFPEVSANGEWHARERMYATAIPRASAIITGTEVGKAEIMQFYRVPPERVKVIPLPTPVFALNVSKNSGSEVLTKYHLPKGYLLYPAQFWSHKNHIGLLLAVNLLREKYDLILPVVFVGSDMGNLRYVRQVIEELSLSKQVYFLGFVSQEDLIQLYRNAFALTFVTFFGPDNLPPLEAFALGCPVIASNVSGAKEQLGDAALLVNPGDEDEIANAIKTLLDDPILRDTLVSRGVARASKWTSEDYVKRVFSLMDEFEPVIRCWNMKKHNDIIS